MDHSEVLISSQPHDTRMLCPECSDARKKSTEKSLSVTHRDGAIFYDCHHCGYAGRIKPESMADQMKKYDQPKKVIKIPTQLNYDHEPLKAFFQSRGITIDDMSKMPAMISGKHWFANIGNVDAVGFVYGNKAEPDSVKWRAVESKAFIQDGCAKEFYGLDRIKPDTKELVIVEGEADVVALASIGIASVSCPNGAPMKVSNNMVSPEEDKKFSYLWESKELLDQVEKIILAVDQDSAGDALAEEIARRVGRARCWRTQYPEGTKDPTDVLNKYDEKTMRLTIDKSEPMPLLGVYAAEDYSSKVMEAYHKGYGHGEATGMKPCDQIFTVKEGLLYIVTGLPSSGKSEFVDQIMLNLARDKSWKWAVASFENPVDMHIAKLSEKYVGKPFFEGQTPRMNLTELKNAKSFINDHFVFLENKDGNLSTMRSIIDRTKAAVMRMGVRGLVIDPYNYIQQEGQENEHQQINQMLTTIVAFAQAYKIAVFFVAHPAKVYQREDGTMPVVKGMNISGSAAWFAKADVGLTVHRGDMVEIHCWKSRFKWIGTQGVAHLGYDVPTGRYMDGAKKGPWCDAPANTLNDTLDDLEF